MKILSFICLLSILVGGVIVMNVNAKQDSNFNPAEKIKVFNYDDKKYEEMAPIVKTEEEWKQELNAQQFHITIEHGTEPPFRNEYWDNKKEGVYRSVNSGVVLFSSKDKFDSGTGWPSFTKPVAAENITYHEDNSLFMKRIEVRDAVTGAHLGHVFNDGPAPTFKRYCINSAALVFEETKTEE